MSCENSLSISSVKTSTINYKNKYTRYCSWQQQTLLPVGYKNITHAWLSTSFTYRRRLADCLFNGKACHHYFQLLASDCTIRGLVLTGLSTAFEKRALCCITRLCNFSSNVLLNSEVGHWYYKQLPLGIQDFSGLFARGWIAFFWTQRTLYDWAKLIHQDRWIGFAKVYLNSKEIQAKVRNLTSEQSDWKEIKTRLKSFHCWLWRTLRIWKT